MKKTTKIILAIILCLLVAATVTLAVLLAEAVKKNNRTEAETGALYERRYYDAMTGLENVETKLSKVSVLTGQAVRRELLADVWKECDAAVSNLSQLGRDGEEAETIMKFLNQVGDYAHYLMGKVSAGEPLTQTEKENVRRFRLLVQKLRADLSAVGESTVSDDKISADTLRDLSAVRDAIRSYSSIDYPELIYDGPFSDGLNDREAKFLQGKPSITQEEAAQRITALFPSAQNVSVVGKTAGSIPCFVAEFASDGINYTVLVTENGGMIASLNAYAETNDPQKTEDECVIEGKNFLSRIGYENMESVWVYNNDSTVYVNFAYARNDVVFYPDLIKVKISLNDGKILGMEASNYLYNHGERTIDFDRSAENTIAISPDLTVLNSRYCVIPTEWNEEVFCKEIKGTADGGTYYVYYDLGTGEEIRALVVIDVSGNKLI